MERDLVGWRVPHCFVWGNVKAFGWGTPIVGRSSWSDHVTPLLRLVKGRNPPWCKFVCRVPLKVQIGRGGRTWSLGWFFFFFCF